MADLRRRGGKGVLSATTDSGADVPLAATPEGHLEIAIHAPRNPFGSIHAEALSPVVQADAVYGLNDQLVTTRSSGTGAVAVNNSMFQVSTGTTIYSQGVLLSRKRLRYRPGQGFVGRFTAMYTTPVASSYQVAGWGHAEDGIFFGYKDLDFGILYSRYGVRETRTLTVSTASTTNENVTVTLNGTAFAVAVTNSGSTLKTAFEISRGTFTGWDAESVGSTVIFVKQAVGVVAGSFSLTATTAVGAFAQTKAGAAATETFIKQTEWNQDKLDGTGLSGASIDPTKLNVFQVKLQYLGAGAITFEVEANATGNNPEWLVVHVMQLPNTLTRTSFGNPSFPFTLAAYSAGSTTNLTVSCGSFGGFVEGYRQLHANRFTYVNSLTTVGATNLQALFTIRNLRYYAGRSNQAVIYLLSLSGALKHTSPVIYYLIRNGTLAGTPNFQQLTTVSCSTYDTAATTVTYADNSQLLWTGHAGDTGEIDHHFNSNGEEVTLQPGEWVTLAAKAVTGTPSYVTGSINTREDQ